MGQLGAEWILRKAEENQHDITDGLNILTVCNTGSLATSVSISGQVGAVAGELCLEVFDRQLLSWSPSTQINGINLADALYDPGIWNRSRDHHSTPRSGQAEAGVVRTCDPVPREGNL